MTARSMKLYKQCGWTPLQHFSVALHASMQTHPASSVLQATSFVPRSTNTTKSNDVAASHFQSSRYFRGLLILVSVHLRGFIVLLQLNSPLNTIWAWQGCASSCTSYELVQPNTIKRPEPRRLVRSSRVETSVSVEHAVFAARPEMMSVGRAACDVFPLSSSASETRFNASCRSRFEYADLGL